MADTELTTDGKYLKEFYVYNSDTYCEGFTICMKLVNRHVQFLDKIHTFY